ncbi:MAG TPA: DEAD/DEAH box helicase [bacterium]|nr:DEAD/DEAH box helicase [bacterium]
MTTLHEILRHVGEAPQVPFAPAPFQRDALAAMGRGDVLVSAPTGSGKTWIAEQYIARALGDAAAAGVAPPRVWYTTPLKALSNQKFRKFQALFGDPTVGLLTGERRVNARAPVLVATTEILRNVLYDTRGRETPPAAIVLDEAHYLSDPERGTAWEEIILLAPREARLLLLSATIPNAASLAAWMKTLRGRAPEVITLETRPVPLALLLADGAGQLLPADAADRIRSRTKHPRWLTTVTEALDRHHLTPAILFFPSRRECDEAARLLGARAAPGEAERARRIQDWLARTPQLASHPLLTALRRAGVASHHAGHLTGWRLCVEELLEAGLVRLVCATTTLAAGLDVPARTVVLSTLHRHGPTGVEPLTPTEFHQMTGRAGRRGRDTLGIVIVAADTADDAREGLALSAAASDPVVSTFTPSDAQVLNLLVRGSTAEAEDMIRRSFAAFLREPEVAAMRARLAAIPADPLVERPCRDRLATRLKFDDLLGRLRRARRREDAAEQVARLGQAVGEMPCTGCGVVDRCLASLTDLAALERERRSLTRGLAALEHREVTEFRARAAILRDLGYLDADQRPTDAGRTTARIRHPRMLVLAEAIRGRILPQKPAALAAVAGALRTARLVLPRVRTLARPGRAPGAPGRPGGPRWEPGPASEEVRKSLIGLRRVVVRVNAARRDAGLPPDPLEDELTSTGTQAAQAAWRASAVGAWAEERPWGSITTRHHIPDGDLQRLVWQAAEILAQLEDLPGHPLAPPARDGRAALLRPPIV